MPSVQKSNSLAATKAGITTDAAGERMIPSSVRADGSVRKEIRVRPGYKPPEDVEVYKNKTAEAWKTRGFAGIPGATGLEADSEEKLPAANRNAKRRDARKKAALANAAQVHPIDLNGTTPRPVSSENAVHEEDRGTVPKATDPEADKEKEAKKLCKKLRQAREPKDKKDKGDILLPEQFDKVIKMNELIRQLDVLGFDANGEQKEGGKQEEGES